MSYVIVLKLSFLLYQFLLFFSYETNTTYKRVDRITILEYYHISQSKDNFIKDYNLHFFMGSRLLLGLFGEVM